MITSLNAIYLSYRIRKLLLTGTHVDSMYNLVLLIRMFSVSFIISAITILYLVVLFVENFAYYRIKSSMNTDDPDFFSQVPADNITTIKMDKKFDRLFFRTHEKLYQLKDLPYDNTFLLDTETILLDNPETLLGSKQHLQIARETRPPNDPLDRVLLRQYNSGFIVVECNKQWKKIINQAIDVFENFDSYPVTEQEKANSKWQGDQWFVHKAIDLIYDTKIGVLPQEWNVRKALLDVIEKPKIEYQSLSAGLPLWRP